MKRSMRARSTIGAHHFANQGLSLVEVLVSVLIMGSLMIISTYLISHLIYNSKTTLKQAVVDDWGRIDYLLETDIREALTISVNTATATLCGKSIANPIITLGTAYSSDPIVYYNDGTSPNSSLRRCGPAILLNGQLSSATSDSLVAENASIAATLLTDVSVVKYDVTFSLIGVTETGSARLRARQY